MPAREKQFLLWLSEEMHSYIKEQGNASKFLRDLVRSHRHRLESAEELLDLYPNEEEALKEALSGRDIDHSKPYAQQVATAMREGKEENVHGRWGVHDWDDLTQQIENSEAKAKSALVISGAY